MYKDRCKSARGGFYARGVFIGQIMKKLWALLFLSVWSLPAAGWGLFNTFPQEADRLDSYRYFLIYPLLQGKHALNVCVTLENYPEYRNEADVKQFLLDAEQKAFDAWFSGTRQVLQNSGRTQEFADVLAVLPQRVQLNLVNPGAQKCDGLSYDLLITGSDRNVMLGATSQLVSQGTASPSLRGGNAWQIMLPTQDISKELYQQSLPNDEIRVISLSARAHTENVALHETGHLLGLADQYRTDDPSGTNAHAQYSLLNFENIFALRSAMRESGGSALAFSCDDAEGLIHAADFILRAEGKKSPRLQNGWADLCGRNYVYINGLPVRAKDAAAAKRDRDEFAAWAAAGYESASKPAFASSAEEQQSRAKQQLVNMLSQYSNTSDLKRELELKSSSLRDELDYARKDPSYLTRQEIQEKTAELARIQQQLQGVTAEYDSLQTQRQQAKARGLLPSGYVAAPPASYGGASAVPSVLDGASVAPAAQQPVSSAKTQAKADLDGFIRQYGDSLRAILSKRRSGQTLNSSEAALYRQFEELHAKYKSQP